MNILFVASLSILIYYQAQALDEYKLNPDDDIFLRNLGIDVNLVHGIAEVKHPSWKNVDQPATGDDEQVNSGDLEIDYNFYNGTTIHLKLQKRDETLASSTTPVWRTYYDIDDDEWSHEVDCQAMADVGSFSLYHDYNHKVAVVLFEKDNTVEGYYYGYTLVARQTETNETKSYFLVYNPDVETYKPRIPMNTAKSSQSSESSRTRRNAPNTAYPELLISLTSSSVASDTTKAIRTAIVYFNAVDMLFSQLTRPNIRINIAGILLLEDENGTPWDHHRYLNGHLDEDKALDEVGEYFQRNHVDHDFDLMVAFIPEPMGFEGEILGLAGTDVDCRDKRQRVAIVREDALYVIGAHEISNLFGNSHDPSCQQDEDIKSSVFEWSDCSEHKIRNYFRTEHKTCFNDRPGHYTLCGSPSSGLYRGHDQPEL